MNTTTYSVQKWRSGSQVGTPLRSFYETVCYQCVSGGQKGQNSAAHNCAYVKLNFDPLLKHYRPP